MILDEKLAHHTRLLLNDAGIKAAVIRLTTAELGKLLQTKSYNALIVRVRVRVRVPRCVRNRAVMLMGKLKMPCRLSAR